MELQSGSQCKKRMDPGRMEDIISELPQNIVECILLGLPIKEAVRTSILSQKWRYNWTTLPEIVFDEQSMVLANGKPPNNNFVNIYHVLIHHKGTIQKFSVRFPHFKRINSSNLDLWVLLLKEKGIQEIILEFIKGDVCAVPSRLFLCEHLTYLKLSGCMLKLPCPFNGLRSLRRLDLESFEVTNADFHRLLSGCSVLETLILDDFYIDYLKFDIPSLRFLYVDGVFDHICFDNATHMSMLHVRLIVKNDNVHLNQDNGCNLIMILGCLTSIEKLYLHSHFMKFLSVSHIPTRFPIMFDCLKEICLTVNFEDLDEVSGVLCLLRSSPIFGRLQISAWLKKLGRRRSADDFWKAQNQIGCPMDQLQYVMVDQFFGADSELQFIKYVLGKSPTLEKFIIYPRKKVRSKEPKVLEELMQYPRASVKAEVVICSRDIGVITN
ncbi:F-box/FBD/LRR-repeat protein [Thalictrum thalictroides]|uniref:F-box/FBD/LRR-repeat protein n=1 Tax=Thalictrum thalictroides TaxID=46969 RepID=A0A7J6X5G9_THATH|nr:F-box/FBD/LRR-repeat protein [Thalictrum thalictroides]